MDGKEKTRAFYIEYAALCRKHQMYINSCGCCDSPWISGPSSPCGETEHSPADVNDALEHIRTEAEIDNE